jgi:hypothetical protein
MLMTHLEQAFVDVGALRSLMRSLKRLVPRRIPDGGPADFLTVLIRHQDRAVQAAQLRPNGIELIGQPIGGIRCDRVIRQIEAGMIDNGLLSNQVEMISGHAGRTPRGHGCSQPQATSS